MDKIKKVKFEELFYELPSHKDCPEKCEESINKLTHSQVNAYSTKAYEEYEYKERLAYTCAVDTLRLDLGVCFDAAQEILDSAIDREDGKLIWRPLEFLKNTESE